jgi:hypothetical protein
MARGNVCPTRRLSTGVVPHYEVIFAEKLPLPQSGSSAVQESVGFGVDKETVLDSQVRTDGHLAPPEHAAFIVTYPPDAYSCRTQRLTSDSM